MDRAPLPPHERSWRHPSELAPQTRDVDAASGSDHSLGAIITTGTLAVMVVAALAVTITPPRSASPVALTATTMPAATVSVRGGTSITTSELQASMVALADSVRTNRLHAFTGIPSAIASIPAPVPGVATTGSGATSIVGEPVVIPDLDDDVLVLNDEMTYVVPWRDVAGLDDVGDAIVVDQSGSIVARLVDGRLVVRSDALVGDAALDEPSSGDGEISADD